MDDKNTGNTTNNKKETNESHGQFSEIMDLIFTHSKIYIFKFIALLFVSVCSVFVFSNDCRSAVGTAFTFTGLLFFDQLLVKGNKVANEYNRIAKFCNLFKFVLFCICCLILFCFFNIEAIEKEMSLTGYKWIMFILMALSSLSALVEAFYNIPEQSLPSQQEKKDSDDTTERRE